MEKEKKINTYPTGYKPANSYDDGNVPPEDLPIDIIPDEVPGKDGPYSLPAGIKILHLLFIFCSPLHHGI